jgi:multidrug efflux pump subunit AcrA (membrane-fusion protein)
MMAEVKIFLDQVDDVLSVPVQAVVHSDGGDQVAFQGPDGQFTRRNVDLGAPIDGFVEVVQGFEGGELVALRPQALIGEENRREVIDTPASMRSPHEPLLRSGTYARQVMTRVPNPSPRPPSQPD